VIALLGASFAPGDLARRRGGPQAHSPARAEMAFNMPPSVGGASENRVEKFFVPGRYHPHL
jgi:hypothetical protein